MKIKQSPVLLFLILCLGSFTISYAKEPKSAPDPTDAKAVITDYLNAIGGINAIKKINSLKDTGSFSVQGMLLPVLQKHMLPNKSLQIVSMNGTTVGKNVFNGTKGYNEQMGAHMDLSEAEMADMKAQTSIVPQVDYLTNSNYKLFLLPGTDKTDGGESYKILITMPSGSVDTEFYDKSTKLLVKQVLTKTISDQVVTITNSFSDYRKVEDVLMPYKQTLNIASGAINQSIDIVFTDIKANEGVSDADFE